MFSPTNYVSSNLLNDLHDEYKKHLANDKQLIDLVNDVNEQIELKKDKSMSLNLSIRQREAEANKPPINRDEEIFKTELSFSEANRLKISKDPYLKESIRLMAHWIERLN